MMMVNKEQAFKILSNLYQDILVDMKTEKISNYFSDKYNQTTDGVTTDIHEFTNHIFVLKDVVEKLSISPFYDFLFDEDKQTATLRYIVTVDKKDGNRGEIEVIAIFEFDGDKIVRCHEQSHPLNQNEDFEHLAKINY